MVHFAKLMKRNISLLASDIFMHAWNDKKLFSRRTGFDTHVSNFEFIENEAWFDMDWFEEVISSHWNDKPEVFKHFTHLGNNAGEKLVQYCRGIRLYHNDLSVLQEIFWHSAKLLQDLSVFIPITHPLSLMIEKKVIAILKHHGITDKEMNEKLMAVSVPEKNNGPEEELIDLKKIKKAMNEPSFDLEFALTEHWQKYSYLGYRDLFSEGYSIEFFRKSLEEKDLDQMGLEHIQTSGIQFTQEEQNIIDLLKEFVWFRNYRTEKFFEALFYLEPLWKKISLSCGLGERDLFYYLLNEVSMLFTHNYRIPDDILGMRKRGSALLLDHDNFSLLTGNLLQRKEAYMHSTEEVNTNEIRGMVVCRGKIRGKVTIVHNDHELEKVSDGDILVTGMTTPDFLPALRKASAFVTDEGGITCHAAIVAREMKKPCIVGTKRATQLLKDGELVEVDAEKGFVRII